MTTPRDSLTDLENHRRQLEENVTKLRDALQYWRLWDAEYETLKEEIETLPVNASQDDVVQLRDAFKSELIKGNELDEIFGKDVKTPSQITSVLSRRIDYVTRNIETLEKQLDATEDKLARVSVVANPDNPNEDGEPIMDIFEQLDEDDNVISYRIQSAGDAEDRVKSALERVGIRSGSDDASKDDAARNSAPADKFSPPADASKSNSVVKASNVKTEETKLKPVMKKSVSFAEDTKPADSGGKSATALRVQEIIKAAKAQESISHEKAYLPQGESSEESFLRQEMLKYGRSDISEIGAIVAELTLDDDTEAEDDEWSDDGSGEQEDDDDNAEDQWGRSTSRVLTDDYVTRMRELEQRLALPPSHATQDWEDKPSVSDYGVGTIRVDHKLGPEEPTSSAKKSVRFARSLDIAPDNPSEEPAADERQTTKEFFSNPVGEVSERRPNKAPSAPVADKPKTGSKFKQARNGAPPPRNSSGTPLADTILERKVSSEPKEPDEFDDALVQKELATEYNKMRSRFIQREGGFLKESEDPIQPLEEEDGGQNRVSRFKAALLSKK